MNSALLSSKKMERLKFTDENGQVFAPAPFPSMVVIYNGLKNE